MLATGLLLLDFIFPNTHTCTHTHPLIFKRKTRKHLGKVKDQHMSHLDCSVWMCSLWDLAVCVPTACSGPGLSEESKLCLQVDWISLSYSASVDAAVPRLQCQAHRAGVGMWETPLGLVANQ